MSSHFSKYPLTQQLWKKISQGQAERGSRNLPVNIVSPSLCDDAIQRLAPSLAKHAGCTIIDLNPGVGLWSSKLHEFLKPRSHILVEEQPQSHLPFLQPLLDAPGSRYHYRSWPGVDTGHPARYVKERLIPEPSAAKGEISPILLVANFADNKVRGVAHQIGVQAIMHALRYAYDARHEQSFHAYGPTRFLMWMGDSQKRSLLPRTVGYRNKVGAAMELTMHVEEIVGMPRSSDVKVRREDSLEIESSKRVAERMKDEGIVLPPGRQLRIEGMFEKYSDTTRDWHREYEELLEGFEAHKLSQFVGQPPGPLINDSKSGVRGRATAGLTFTPEYKRFKSLRNIMRDKTRKFEKTKKYAQIQEEIDKLDVKAQQFDIDVEEQKKIFSALDAKIQEFKASLKELRQWEVEAIMFLDDDRRAFAMDPPLLMWDRRRAEPVIAEADEFYLPGKPLALLDFQPKVTQDLPMTKTEDDAFEHIATSLMSVRGTATTKLLNKLAPGAYEALVPKVPALSDPRKGGRRDIESIRNRTLTPEMLHGLALAWEKWPFKPEITGRI